MCRDGKIFEVHAENMDVKGSSGEVLDGNVECVTRNWRKGNPCYKVAKNLAEMCSSVLWKIELLSNETGYLAEKMSMQSVEGATWFLLTAFMVKYERRERNWRRNG